MWPSELLETYVPGWSQERKDGYLQAISWTCPFCDADIHVVPVGSRSFQHGPGPSDPLCQALSLWLAVRNYSRAKKEDPEGVP